MEASGQSNTNTSLNTPPPLSNIQHPSEIFSPHCSRHRPFCPPFPQNTFSNLRPEQATEFKAHLKRVLSHEPSIQAILHHIQPEPNYFEYQRMTKFAYQPVRETNVSISYALRSPYYIELRSKESDLCHTDLQFNFQQNFIGFVQPIRLFAEKQIITNSFLIDPSYPHRISFQMYNLSDKTLVLHSGSKIADLFILPIALPEPKEVEKINRKIYALAGIEDLIPQRQYKIINFLPHLKQFAQSFPDDKDLQALLALFSI